MANQVMLNEPWLKWAIEIQAIAQNGLTYCTDVYDQERYERLREIAAEMLSHKTGIPTDQVKNLFCSETGYQTPKLDTRAAIIENEKILLVQEKTGLWALPGGWADVTETVASNTVKEVREEAGLEARAERIVALQDHNLRNSHPYAYNICKVFVLCKRLGGQFQPSSETIDSGWFALEDLPPLAVTKTTKEQITLCFQAAADPHWQPVFD